MLEEAGMNLGWKDIRRSLEEYSRRPRPTMREKRLTGREVLLLTAVGPAALVGSILRVVNGDLWPATGVAPLSAAVTSWMVVWVRRPTKVVRTMRGSRDRTTITEPDRGSPSSACET